MKRILRIGKGVKVRRARAHVKPFGMSGSTVSRCYMRARARELKKLCERRLEG